MVGGHIDATVELRLQFLTLEDSLKTWEDGGLTGDRPRLLIFTSDWKTFPR